MRLILGDRWSGGMLVVLTAAFVLIQSFASAWACSASVASAATPLLVICHGAGITTIDGPPPGGSRTDLTHGCPCGTLCSVGVAFVAVPPDLDLGAAYAVAAGVDIRFLGDEAAALHPRTDGTPPFPTGPPAISA